MTIGSFDDATKERLSALADGELDPAELGGAPAAPGGDDAELRGRLARLAPDRRRAALGGPRDRPARDRRFARGRPRRASSASRWCWRRRPRSPRRPAPQAPPARAPAAGRPPRRSPPASCSSSATFALVRPGGCPPPSALARADAAAGRRRDRRRPRADRRAGGDRRPQRRRRQQADPRRPARPLPGGPQAVRRHVGARRARRRSCAARPSIPRRAEPRPTVFLRAAARPDLRLGRGWPMRRRRAARRSAPAAAATAPSEVRAWLLRIHDAASRRNFQGTFVVSGGGNVASARIAHFCEGAEPVRADRVARRPPAPRLPPQRRRPHLWPASQVAMIEQRGMLSSFPALLQAGDDGIAEWYEVRAEGGERVAGHEADVLAIRRPRRPALRLSALGRSRVGPAAARRRRSASAATFSRPSAFSDVAIGIRPQPESVSQRDAQARRLSRRPAGR